MSNEAERLAAPYLEVVRGLNPDGALTTYPGSPLLARKLFRPQDRLSAIELHPEDARALGALFAGDVQTRVIHLDGWLALGAHVPPKEKRGLVLVDPPFEQEDDWQRLVEGLVKAHRRWPGGIYALWYPLKDPHEVDDFTCWKTKVTRGTPAPAWVDVVASGALTVPAKTYQVGKPRWLCLAAARDGTPPKHAAAALLCRQAKPARGEAKHADASDLVVSDAFGSLTLGTTGDDVLCLPATVGP